MIISFDHHREKLLERSAYRQQLVDEIMAFHLQHHGEAEAESFYLQHVRIGFPISILENILQRLSSQRVSNE